MNIMVFDVAAEFGGALSILNEFYDETKLYNDKSINWIFVLSKPNFEETENIKLLRFPWVKKSWWHRLYFDNILAPGLVKKYNIDRILSLQNVIVPHTHINQTVYVHQPLPFVEYKVTFRENKLFWMYQNLISRNIIKSIKKANKVIVQTKWMKKACLEKTNVNGKKINIIQPYINICINEFFQPNKDLITTFFYPASSLTYKNHNIIVEACKRLKYENIKDFKIIFTLNGDENKHIADLYKEVQESDLPIQFIGSLTREQVFHLYTKAILLFPSYIETFGLPMLEAKLHKGMILASDCLFSHEILDGYENAYFFNPFSKNELAKLLENCIIKKIVYNKVENISSDTIKRESLITYVVKKY